MLNFKSLNKFIFLIIFTDFTIIYCQDFGYDGEKGPSHWGEQYNACFGKHQSPININSLNVDNVKLPRLQLNAFDKKPLSTNITNNGHTVMITLDTDEFPTVSGGPLNGLYEFNQLHFHWGDNDTFGSEDLIDGKSFAMELHMVFYKKKYRNSRSALDYPDGLTVLAFFYEIANKTNMAYDEFTKLLQKINAPHKSALFDNPPPLLKLIPENVDQYYTYNGSLTTPPCSEVVTWIDFKTPIYISHDQLDMFRALKNSEGLPLKHNFRPIQSLGDRRVLFNTGSCEGDSCMNINNDDLLDNKPNKIKEILTNKLDEDDTEDKTNDNSLNLGKSNANNLYFNINYLLFIIFITFFK